MVIHCRKQLFFVELIYEISSSLCQVHDTLENLWFCGGEDSLLTEKQMVKMKINLFTLIIF